jgi:hypothetical protein
MTAKASASAIIDDLVDSGSFLRTQVSACDYGILDRTTGCAVIVRPSNSSFELVGYGGGRIDTWGFAAEGFIRETGDVVETLTRVLDMQDALLGAISNGSNANCASVSTVVRSMGHNPNVFFEAGGNAFLMVTAQITSTEDP